MYSIDTKDHASLNEGNVSNCSNDDYSKCLTVVHCWPTTVSSKTKSLQGMCCPAPVLLKNVLIIGGVIFHTKQKWKWLH